VQYVAKAVGRMQAKMSNASAATALLLSILMACAGPVRAQASGPSVPGSSCQSAMPFGGSAGASVFSVSIADTSVGGLLPADYDSYGGDDQSSGDEPSADALCPGTFFNGTGAGFWLKLDDVRPGMRLELTSCGFDTDLSVFSGPSCSELEMVACNGDSDVEECDTDYPSRISGLEVVAGTDYYVVVTGYEGATGAANITASYTVAPPPSPQPPPSPPITCECETILVAGAEAVQSTRMGTFTRTSLATPDGRSIYQNFNLQYLYFWAEFSEWRISNNYTSAAAGVTSTSSDSAICPTAASGWQAWDGSTWATPSGGITVTCAPSPPPQSPPQPPLPPSLPPPPRRPSVPGSSCELAIFFGGSSGELEFSASIADTSVGGGPSAYYGSYLSSYSYDDDSALAMCSATGFTGIGEGAWLKLDDVRPGMLLELTSCGFDTDLSVLSGPSCSELSVVACNGDGVVDGCETNSFPSRISGVEVAAGTDYYVIVSGYEGATGAAEVTAAYTFAPPQLPPPSPYPPTPPSPPSPLSSQPSPSLPLSPLSTPPSPMPPPPSPPPPPSSPPPPMPPAVPGSVFVTKAADIRQHLEEAISSGLNLSLALPALTFALGGMPFQCSASIELSVRSFPNGAVLDAEELSSHFILSNGCRLVVEGISLVNGYSEQVRARPAASRPLEACSRHHS
jgi:hypothetical protein